jgi:hypothetical protein
VKHAYKIAVGMSGLWKYLGMDGVMILKWFSNKCVIKLCVFVLTGSGFALMACCSEVADAIKTRYFLSRHAIFSFSRRSLRHGVDWVFPNLSS